jgi:hypothetical protein
MPYSPEQVNELTNTTLRQLGRLKWSLISTSLQEYHAYGRFLKKGQVKTYDGGYGLQWNLQVAATGLAVRSELYDTDEATHKDTMKTATSPWVMVKVPYAIDVRQMSMNSGSSKIVDDWQAQRVAAMVSLAELLESDFWAAPDANDTKKPRALRYYVVKNASAGFNGGTASGFSDVAGLNTTTYPKWRNWTDIYTSISRTDLIRRVKRAMRNCRFMPPVEHPAYASGQPRWEFYTVDDVMQVLGELAENQNQNIGSDLAAYEGRVEIGNVRVNWAPQIDSDTDDPFYGIDWSSFRPCVLAGEYLRETDDTAASSHNLKARWVDMTYGFEMYDRRRNFVVSTGAN